MMSSHSSSLDSKIMGIYNDAAKSASNVKTSLDAVLMSIYQKAQKSASIKQRLTAASISTEDDLKYLTHEDVRELLPAQHFSFSDRFRLMKWIDEHTSSTTEANIVEGFNTFNIVSTLLFGFSLTVFLNKADGIAENDKVYAAFLAMIAVATGAAGLSVIMGTLQVYYIYRLFDHCPQAIDSFLKESKPYRMVTGCFMGFAIAFDLIALILYPFAQDLANNITITSAVIFGLALAFCCIVGIERYCKYDSKMEASGYKRKHLLAPALSSNDK